MIVNNYQAHMDMPDRRGEQVTLHLKGEDIIFDFGIAGDENVILTLRNTKAAKNAA